MRRPRCAAAACQRVAACNIPPSSPPRQAAPGGRRAAAGWQCWAQLPCLMTSGLARRTTQVGRRGHRSCPPASIRGSNPAMPRHSPCTAVLAGADLVGAWCTIGRAAGFGLPMACGRCCQRQQRGWRTSAGGQPLPCACCRGARLPCGLDAGGPGLQAVSQKCGRGGDRGPAPRDAHCGAGSTAARVPAGVLGP